MSKQPLRYYVRLVDGQWQIVDREHPPLTELVLAILQSEACARSACESLNRGLCESIAPDGRWGV